MATIIYDLAMMLIVAGITCLIFKKLNQPLVLGYIVAGFLTSPNFSYFPTIANKENVLIWSEIGVIFLMFALGLEFSFYKLKKVGSSAFIATAVAVTGMVITGYIAGTLLGWSHMNSLFLGGMLSMSSTAIIFKAFEDLGLKEEKFANFVLGVLIIEDIAGIVMMVLLSTIATASANISTTELLWGIGKLVFCLILWFVLGMYLVPTFFKRVGALFNDETLLIVSIGLCLCMVAIAEHAGFSSALGAFIMGSLIAEAPESEKIEHLISPVKNLFSAVFFVSVGMLVNPTLLLQYIGPVVVLIIVTIIGQITWSTLGMLAAGQSLKTAMRSGFCLCQIGEFSFILAGLGIEHGVTSKFLYPIIVAVSITTTFLTPFCMGFAEPAFKLAEKILPKKLLQKLPQENEEATNLDENAWLALLQNYFLRLLIYSVLLIAISMCGSFYLLPYLSTNLALPYSNYITAAIMLLFMAPILGIMLQSNVGNQHFTILWYRNRFNHIPLRVLLLAKIVVVAIALYFVFHNIAGMNVFITATAILLALYYLATTPWLLSQYLRMESRFLVNLNEKHVKEYCTGANSSFNASLDNQLEIASYTVSPNSPLVGKQLKEIYFRQEYGCEVIRITTNNNSIFMPSGNDTISADSHITVIGKAFQTEAFANAIKIQRLELQTRYETQTLRQYMLNESIPKDYQLFVTAIPATECSPIIGKAIRDLTLREEWNLMIIGLDRGEYSLPTPDVNLVIEDNDLIWLLGSPKDIKSLLDKLPVN